MPGTRLLTPNEAELHRLVDDADDASGGDRLSIAARGAQLLRDRWRAGAVAVTMGGDGALLCHSGATALVIPAPEGGGDPAPDTCGAGDQFAAAATAALARGALVSEAV